jgi:hypothetical protein
MGAELQLRHPIQTVESIRLAELICRRGGTHKPCCFALVFGRFSIFLSISTISDVTLFTQLAPFALFCDLDVTPDFSPPIL